MIVNPGIRRFVGGVNGILRSLFFYAPRTSSITQTRGAGTPTETRATVATVMGYAADAVLADGQTLLTVASGELRFQGARRVSEGVWSNVDADGAPIPAATLDGSVVEAAATNLIWPSNDLTNAQWTARGTASAVKNATGPDGVANSATTIVINTSAGPNDIYYTTALSGLGDGTRGEPHLWINKTTASGIVTFQNASGAGVGVWTINLANVPSGWNRITRDHAAVTIGSEFASTAGGAVQLQFFCNTGGPVTLAVYGVNYVTGATYSSETIATTTAAVTRNADVLDDQVASNLTAAAGTVAFTWTPSHDPSGTIALCGAYVDASNYTMLLAQKVNNLTAQNTTTITAAAGWTTSNVSSVGGVTDPDGGSTAYTVTATAGNGFIHDGGSALATTVTALASWWVRRRTGTGNVFMYDGSPSFGVYNITSLLTSSWKRIPALAITSGANAAIGFNLITNGDAIDVWHPLLENVAGNTNQLHPAPYTATSATFAIWRKVIAAVAYDAYIAHEYANGTSAKISVTNGASGTQIAVDGVLGTPHANTDDAQLGTRWQWGADGNGGQQAGAAFKEKYLTPRTTSDAELQAITV